MNDIYWKLAGILLLIGLMSIISQIRSDIARINSNLNKIAKQVGVPDTITDEVKILLSEGKRIKAIKKYRTITGADLVEATQYIDSLKFKK